jgi:hypothetical protein
MTRFGSRVVVISQAISTSYMYCLPQRMNFIFFCYNSVANNVTDSEAARQLINASFSTSNPKTF